MQFNSILLSIILLSGLCLALPIEYCKHTQYLPAYWKPPWYVEGESTSIKCFSETGMCAVRNFVIVPGALRYNIDGILPIWTYEQCWGNGPMQAVYNLEMCMDEHLSYAMTKIGDWKKMAYEERYLTSPAHLVYSVPLGISNDLTVVFITRDTTHNLFHALAGYFAAYDSLVRNGLDPRQSHVRDNIQVVLIDNHFSHEETGIYHPLWSTISNHPVLYVDEWSKYNRRIYPSKFDFNSDIMPHHSTPTFIRNGIFIPKTLNCSPFWHFHKFQSLKKKDEMVRMLNYWADYMIDESYNTKLSRLVKYSNEELGMVIGYNIVRSNVQKKLPELMIIQRLKNSAQNFKPSVGRTIINQNDILLLLKKEFENILRVTVVDFVEIPIFEQINMVHGADILMGVHGAGLTHLMFTKPGAVVLEIYPSRLPLDNSFYSGRSFEHLAKLLGKNYFSWTNDDTSHGYYPVEYPDGRMDELWLNPQKIVELIHKSLLLLRT